MTVTARKRQELAKRRRKVASLYLEGWAQWDIAEEVGVDQSTISRDLKAVRKQWMKEAERDFDAKVAQELARLDAIELEAWQEWQASKKRQRTKLVKRDTGRVQSVEKTVETLLPEARYLEIVQKCIERRCKILGIEAPQKVGVDVSMSEEEKQLWGKMIALAAACITEPEMMDKFRNTLREWAGGKETNGET